VVFDDYVKAIVDILWRQPAPAILVGHSSAGFLLQSAAPLVPRKIERLVFLNAFILPHETAQFDVVPPASAQALTATANASSDGSVPVIEDFVRGVLMAGEPIEAQDALLRKLTPQPLTLFTTKVDTSAFDRLDIPKAVVFCKDDVSLPPGAYLKMAESLGRFDLIELEGGHEALITNPDRIAEGLLRLAAQ
jgi:pimeloyl-ACP methyl ester carboxylesterase